MKDLRGNKTELYIIVENSCVDGCEEIKTFIYDNTEVAHKNFERFIEDDKEFLKEEGRDNVIVERDGYCYQSYPDGNYAESHYYLDLFVTKHNEPKEINGMSPSRYLASLLLTDSNLKGKKYYEVEDKYTEIIEANKGLLKD
jgi:hypothetical protein